MNNCCPTAGTGARSDERPSLAANAAQPIPATTERDDSDRVGPGNTTALWGPLQVPALHEALGVLRPTLLRLRDAPAHSRQDRSSQAGRRSTLSPRRDLLHGAHKARPGTLSAETDATTEDAGGGRQAEGAHKGEVRVVGQHPRRVPGQSRLAQVPEGQTEQVPAAVLQADPAVLLYQN